MRNTTILLVDDHTLFRKGIREMLPEKNPLQNILEASNGAEAIEHLKKRKIDLVILDVQMPVMNGYETMELIAKKYPRTKVIILTQHDSTVIILHMLKAGAKGFLLKNVEPDEFQSAIEGVMQGGLYFSDQIFNLVMANLRELDNLPNLLFTPREKDLIPLFRQGKSNKEIAALLNLEVSTINTYQGNLCAKTKTKDKAELIAYIHSHGLGFLNHSIY